jgi:polyisoprenoid-binding protein YceI
MRRLAFLLVLAVGGAARAQAAADYAVDAKSSTLTYHLVHKMHKVNGVSHKLDGKARVTPDGKAQVMLRAPSESFDSGNVNRDAHMKESVEAAKFPFIELKALGEGLTPPSTFPTTQKKSFKAQLTFHGVQQVFEIPVELTWESASKVRAQAALTLSLDQFKVERPSLMFVKVDDELKIDAKVVFTR